DEPLVARDIDDLDHEPVRLLEIGEADVDRDAAGLLFGQPVRVDAGQRAYERRLAVVDMAGRPDDDVRGGVRHRATSELGENASELRELVREDGPAVEEQPVVLDAPHHRGGRAP